MQKLSQGVSKGATPLDSPEKMHTHPLHKLTLDERRDLARQLVLEHGGSLPLRVLRRALMRRGRAHRNTVAGDVEALLDEPGFILDGKVVKYRGGTKA